MSAKNIRFVSVFIGIMVLLLGFNARRNWVKMLLLALGAMQIVGNLLAKDEVFEELEAQINEQINRCKSYANNR